MAYFTSIRYGKMLLVGRFKTERQDLHARERCVVRTDRGKELGEILTALEPVPESLPAESLWDILRRADPADVHHADRLEKESVPRARQVCKELIQKLNLPMKLVEVDYVFGGERIIFYFTSDSRVDFRELVRLLAHEFRTRIELKQVGARDETRLIGDCGHCGLTLCCRGHLKELGGINMDMAKVQKHTADPSKITGRCGKLLCCLRYEYHAYTESRELLPPRGTRVETRKGTGVVVDQNLLMREVTIEQAGGDRVVVKLEEIQGSPAPVAGCDGCAAPKTGETTRVATDVREKIERETVVTPPVLAGPPGETRPAASPPAAPGTRSRPEPPPRPPLWMRLGPVEEFPPGAPKAVDLGGPVVAVFNVDGGLHVLDNACPHQGGPLGEGKLEGAVVTCPLHQWQFDVTTGKGVSVSGSQARRYEAEVAGGQLYIRI